MGKVPGALLGVVGGSGVLKGSKGWGSKLKGVVLEFGRGVMEELDLSWLKIIMKLINVQIHTLPKTSSDDIALYTHGLGFQIKQMSQ